MASSQRSGQEAYGSAAVRDFNVGMIPWQFPSTADDDEFGAIAFPIDPKP
jgi:hypothetical protein